MKHVKSYLSLAAGALLPLAFAPYCFWPLAMLCPAILLTTFTLHKSALHFVSFKLALWRGFLFGLGLFGVGASWIYISIHTFGNTPALIAGIITALFVIIMASFPALHVAMTTRFSPPFLWISFPALGALLEWVRSWFLSGFPWLQLGQSQTIGVLKGFAPIFGVYGVSFIALLCGTLFFNFCRLRKWGSAFLLLGILLSGYLFTFLHWTLPFGPPLNVTLIQGNIPQETKWSADHIVPTVRTYIDMTQQSWHTPTSPAPLVFWPEGAIPLPLPSAQPFLNLISTLAKQQHTSIILGLPVAHAFSYYNAIVMVGQNHGIYYKRHLVPFGEYLPFSSLLKGLIGFFDIPMSDFIAGPHQQPLLKTENASMGTFICYEIAYSDLLYDTLQQHPDFLITLSNDTWFGESWASYQHAQIAQFSALMSGRYMILNANSGLTAIFDDRGNRVEAIPLFVRDTLQGSFFRTKGYTPWDYYGDKPALLLAGLLLFLLWAFSK